MKKWLKRSIPARSYQSALAETLADVNKPGRVLLQDNAPNHTARATKKWLTDWVIPLLEIPVHSGRQWN